MRVAYYDSDDRAGLRGYVQFNKYVHTYMCVHTRTYIFNKYTYIHTHTHTHNTRIHTYIHTYRINASGIE